MSFVTGVLIPIVAGVLLMSARFTKTETPKWVGNALFFAGAAALLAGITSLLWGHECDAGRACNRVRLRGGLGGMVIGSLVTLAIAGQLKFRKPAKDKQS